MPGARPHDGSSTIGYKVSQELRLGRVLVDETTAKNAVAGDGARSHFETQQIDGHG